jgi:predicted CXXCH cytochrome family protein
MRWLLCILAAAGALLGQGVPGLAGPVGGTDAPAYLGSADCRGCHGAAFEAWEDSHHARAWTEPTPETVRGDFDDAVFDDGATRARFYRDGARYMIETAGADGVVRAFPVVGVAGWAPLQQYLLAPAPGRTQAFDIAWDVEGRRWYPVLGDLPPPEDGMHWTGVYKSWEARCAECHATGYVRNYDPAARRYAPVHAEIGVGCEACHGPGAAHVAWAREGRAPGAGLTPRGLTVDLAASARVEVEQCATCHARREAFGDGNPLPGTPLHDAFGIALLRPGVYAPDGGILDENYEYGSFVQSKMAAAGVRCSDCHAPHGAALRAEGNAVCTQCHSPAGNPAFPGVRRADYGGPAHGFHPEGSAGGQCVACHMPARTYMGVDARRDHYFRVPRPDLAAFGVEDACTACHADRTPEWAAAEIAARYPEPTRRGAGHAPVFFAAQWDLAAQVPALLAIAEGEGSGIVRATAAGLIPPTGDPAVASRLAALLQDPDPLVRAAAMAPMVGLAPPVRLQLLARSLSDPVRAVRIAAARALVEATPPPGSREAAALTSAQQELAAALVLNADFPEAQLQVGGIGLRTRDWRLAEAAFAEAAALDPQLLDAWTMVVRIRATLGDDAGARSALAAALAANPGAPGLLSLEADLASR